MNNKYYFAKNNRTHNKVKGISKWAISLETNFTYFLTVSTDIGALHDPVTWYKITQTGEQVAQWDFQNNATRTNLPGPVFVLELPLSNLLTSMWDFVPCDRIVPFDLCRPGANVRDPKEGLEAGNSKNSEVCK